MDLYTIDVETYYDREYSLSKITTEEYVRDQRFELIGLSIKKNDKKVKWLSGDIIEVYAALHTIDWSQAAILCHNTMFDGAVLAWRLGIKPAMWFDTLSMARAIHGPDARGSLAALADRYELPPKGDEVVRALGKRRSDFTTEELAAYAAYCKHDTDLCYQIFNRMLAEVPGGFPRKELKLIDLTLRMFTEPKLHLNKAKLEAHLDATVRAKEKLLFDAGVSDKKDLMSNDKFATMLSDLGIAPPRKVSPTTGKETWAFAKTDEAFKELLDHEDPNVQTLVAARLGNKTTLEETRTQRFIGISERGLLPIPLRYYAAHTGRWGGADKINLQNLPSRGPNAKQIKGAIEAPPGCVIVESDSSQIEARMLAWLAEQEDVVQAFRDKEDVYKKMAATIYGVAEEDVTKDQRQVGKGVVLGCGYGMGGDKFQATMKNQGVELSLKECKRIVSVYREANYKVSALWKSAGVMLDRMSKNHVHNFGKAGVLSVEPEEFGVRLPSGLMVQYPGLKAHQSNDRWEYTYDTRKGPNRIYGGKVTENCLAGDTEVLTDEGWVHLRDVTRAHRVWDGTMWVKHDGLIYQGKKATTIVNGVRMTPDHNVLTERGWRCASSSEGLHRAGFWLPDGGEVSGYKWPTLSMGLPVQLRDGSFSYGYRRGKVCPAWWAPVVRVQGWGREQIARLVEAPSVLGMAIHAGPVPLTDAPSMAQLWSTGDQGVPGVAAIVRRILERHGRHLQAGVDAGSSGQQRRLYPGELSVGDACGAGGEQAQLTPGGYNHGTQDDGRFQVDPDVSLEPEPVYDILNAGPESRFVVRGSSGPFIVHNCVQALARIVVGEQMLKISRKYDIALTVHDSVLIVVPEDEAAVAKAYVEECMSWAPKWADGLPVACEAGVGQNYGDA